LNLPIDIIGVPTVREASGLAMSSRNAYLTESEKRLAPLLYQILLAAQNSVLTGQQSYHVIEQSAFLTLQHTGFSPDYFTICRRCDLQCANSQDTALVILAAARLGKARLIDNIEVQL
jgi:pantoate--beta-alanine ligase